MNYDLESEVNDLLVETKYIATAFSILKAPDAPRHPVTKSPLEGEISVADLRKALADKPQCFDSMEVGCKQCVVGTG
jgi:hypothetical protein